MLTVKEVRSKIGMKQTEFSEYFHVNISTLRMWEQGVNRTPDYVLFLLNKVLELDGSLVKETTNGEESDIQ